MQNVSLGKNAWNVFKKSIFWKNKKMSICRLQWWRYLFFFYFQCDTNESLLEFGILTKAMRHVVRGLSFSLESGPSNNGSSDMRSQRFSLANCRTSTTNVCSDSLEISLACVSKPQFSCTAGNSTYASERMIVERKWKWHCGTRM